MGKVFVRVDDRLIHGQTIVAWCPTLGIQEIVAIDDTSATNPMLKSIMEMGVPKMYKTHIVTTDDAKKILSTPSDNTRLVIVKYPSRLKELQNEIKGCESVILGNMAKRDDTNHQMTGATGIFYLSDQDINDINELIKDGFNVSFQQLPNAAGTSWDSFIKSI